MTDTHHAISAGEPPMKGTSHATDTSHAVGVSSHVSQQRIHGNSPVGDEAREPLVRSRTDAVDAMSCGNIKAMRLLARALHRELLEVTEDRDAKDRFGKRAMELLDASGVNKAQIIGHADNNEDTALEIGIKKLASERDELAAKLKEAGILLLDRREWQQVAQKNCEENEMLRAKMELVQPLVDALNDIKDQVSCNLSEALAMDYISNKASAALALWSQQQPSAPKAVKTPAQTFRDWWKSFEKGTMLHGLQQRVAKAAWLASCTAAEAEIARLKEGQRRCPGCGHTYTMAEIEELRTVIERLTKERDEAQRQWREDFEVRTALLKERDEALEELEELKANSANAEAVWIDRLTLRDKEIAGWRTALEETEKEVAQLRRENQSYSHQLGTIRNIRAFEGDEPVTQSVYDELKAQVMDAATVRAENSRLRKLLKEASNLLVCHHDMAYQAQTEWGDCSVCSYKHTQSYPDNIFGRIEEALRPRSENEENLKKGGRWNP